MEPILIGAIAGGGAAAIAVLLTQRRIARPRVDILPVLRARGPSTIPDIMTALGLEGIQAQGKVVLALDAVVRSGKVAEGAVPRGTPVTSKIRVRRYTALT